MISCLQKSLYRLGLLSPILIINFVLGVILRNDSSAIAWVSLVIGIVLLLYHVLFLYLVNKKLPVIQFKVDTVPEENDLRLLEISISYALPLLQFIDGNQRLNPNISCLSLVAVCFVILTVVNNTFSSPVYVFLGYHYHVVESKNKKYTVISRQKNYRNANKILAIKRVFEDLLIIC